MFFNYSPFMVLTENKIIKEIGINRDTHIEILFDAYLLIIILINKGDMAFYNKILLLNKIYLIFYALLDKKISFHAWNCFYFTFSAISKLIWYRKYTSDHYLYAMAYYINQSIYILFSYTNEKIEMLLHHFITLMMIFLSYRCNLLSYGIQIQLIHDISDPLLEMSKILFITNKKVTETSKMLFTLWIILFVVTRIFYFPSVIYQVLIRFNFLSTLIEIEIIELFLILLQMMHIYWIYRVVPILMQMFDD